MMIRPLLILSLVSLCFQQDTAAQSDVPEEYNFSWLDPEKKIYVLQNRKYLKAFRGFIGVMGGAGFNAPFHNILNLDARASFYFSEAFGIEAFATFGFPTENGNVTALPGGVVPFLRTTPRTYGGFLQWLPWYAKINVFNNIIYFDWYFAVGGSYLETFRDRRLLIGGQPLLEADPMWAGALSTGHFYHFSKNFYGRFDLTVHVYYPVMNFVKETRDWTSNWNLGLGFGVKL